MPGAPDPALAAGRLAELVRAGRSFRYEHDGLSALLPVLDAVARGAEGGRVERYARAICAAQGHDPDADFAEPKPNFPDPPYYAVWQSFEPEARAALALADAEGAAYWQPIDTAPKDGTRVLLWGVERAFLEPRAFVGRWDAESAGGCWNGREWRAQPTHWRPMPAPPSTRP